MNNRITDFFMKRAILATRRGYVYDVGLTNSMFQETTYTKKSMRKMVEDLPYIRGAISSIVNAVCGSYRFISIKSTVDDDTENPQVEEITRWALDPEVNLSAILEKIMFVRLMRANVFLELQPPESKNEYPMIFVLNPEYCKSIYNKKMTIRVGIEYRPPTLTPSDESIIFKENNFLISTTDNFDGSETGFPPMETLIPDANLYVASRNFVKSLYNSGGVGIQAFILEEGSDDEFRTLREDLKQTRGTSIAVKGKKLKIQSLSNTPKDMEYGNMDNVWKQKVMTSLGVPPVMMAMGNDNAFKDSSKSQMNVFSSRVRAEHRFLKNIVDRAIIKLFGEEYDHVRIVFDDFVDPLTQSEIWKLQMDIGVLTPNIVRRYLGLPRIKDEWADLPYNFNFPPQREEAEMGMGQVPSKQEEEEKKYLIKLLTILTQDIEQRTTFMSRLNHE